MYLASEQLYSMLTIFFGVDEWTPDERRINEVANHLGLALLASERTKLDAVERFIDNVKGRRDFIARGGTLR